MPTIEYSPDGQQIHTFKCLATHCRGKGIVHGNLETADATSTSNLRKHAILCWGKEAVDAATNTKSLRDAREVLGKSKGILRDGSLAIEFERAGKNKLTFTMRPPTKMESRADHVRWMAESKRPFHLVGDPGYQRVMKNGRPAHYIPSRNTISRDVRTVFTASRNRIARLLQVRGHFVE